MFEDFEDKNFKFLSVEIKEEKTSEKIETTKKFFNTFLNFILKNKNSEENIAKLSIKMANSQKLSQVIKNDFQSFLFEKREENLILFQKIAENLNGEILKEFLSKTFSLFENLPSFDETLNYLIEFSNNELIFNALLDAVQKFYGEKYFDDFLLKIHANLFVFEFLAKNENFKNFKTFFLYQNSKRETILHFTILNSEKFVKIIKVVKENASEEIQKELIQIKNEKGENILKVSISKNEFFFKNVFELAESSLKSEMKNFMHEKDEDGQNILHYAACFAKSKETFEVLWQKLGKFFDDEQKFKNYLKIKDRRGRNILFVSISKRNKNSFFYIFEEIYYKIFNYEDFSYELDESGENFLHYLARFGSVSMLEFAFKKLEENLSPGELQNLIKIKSKVDQNNLLHCAALQNTDESSVKFLFEKSEKLLGKDEIKKMLNEPNGFKSFVIHLTIEFNNSEICKLFAKIYKENFEKEEIKNILDKKDFGKILGQNEIDQKMKKKVEEFVEKLNAN
jgi:hypothetical protein